MRAIGSGAVVAALFVAPNIGLALAPFLRADDPYERREWNRRRVQAALKRLAERRYVRFEEQGKNTYIVITEFGKRRLRQFDFETLALPERPRRWDGKWRMVVFDIPEKRKRARMALSAKLVHVGMLALQRSVYVYPHPCEDEVDFLCQFLDVDRHTHVIEAASLGTAEGKARRRFGLL